MPAIKAPEWNLDDLYAGPNAPELKQAIEGAIK